jgi:hypothetical protein
VAEEREFEDGQYWVQQAKDAFEAEIEQEGRLGV